MTLIKEIIKYYKNKYPDLNVPTNDIEAFQLYPDFNWVYNRHYLALLQSLETFPLPIKPNKFPVVIKPFINLKGMGLNSFKIDNLEEYYKYTETSHFWTEFLEGNHYSIDLVINQGKIIYYIIFQGIKSNTFGSFEYWKEIDLKLDDNKLSNINLILSKMNDYTGCLNIEMIGNYIIECHLRMGDIDMKQEEILDLIMYNYLNKKDKIEKYLDITKSKKYKKIYLIPVWGKKLTTDKMIKIYDTLQETIEPILIQNKSVYAYYFDNPYHPNPTTKKRWFQIITHNFKKGITLRNKINKLIQKEEKLIN